MTNPVPATARALAFLTRIPMPSRYFAPPHAAPSEDAWAFGLAGALVALPGALLLNLFGANPAIAAGLALAATALLTGALHEDGLADTADGFWGGRDRQRRLEIMKDSATGSYGMLALLLATGLQWAALAELAGWRAGLAFIACNSLSRAAMVWHWASLPSARPDGVATASGQPDTQTMQRGLIVAAPLFTLPVLAIGGPLGLLAGLGAAGLAGWAITCLARDAIGGHTGDTIGATQQVVQTMALTALALAV